MECGGSESDTCVVDPAEFAGFSVINVIKREFY